MKRYIQFFMIWLTLTWFIMGCSSKDEKDFMRLFSQSKTEHKYLQKTEKIQLFEPKDGNSSVLLTATYLSKKQHLKSIKKDEIFIIGLYIEEDETKEITLEHFTLHLNGKSPKSIKRLKEQSTLLKQIPFVSSWKTFYMVHFPHISDKSMQLFISHAKYGEGRASFAKVAKYLLKKEFL